MQRNRNVRFTLESGLKLASDNRQYWKLRASPLLTYLETFEEVRRLVQSNLRLSDKSAHLSQQLLGLLCGFFCAGFFCGWCLEFLLENAEAIEPATDPVPNTPPTPSQV